MFETIYKVKVFRQESCESTRYYMTYEEAAQAARDESKDYEDLVHTKKYAYDGSLSETWLGRYKCVTITDGAWIESGGRKGDVIQFNTGEGAIFCFHTMSEFRSILKRIKNL